MMVFVDTKSFLIVHLEFCSGQKILNRCPLANKDLTKFKNRGVLKMAVLPNAYSEPLTLFFQSDDFLAI